MATKRRYIVEGTKAHLTRKQLEELEAAKKLPPVYDEESPELTEKQIAEFMEIAKQQRDERRKQVVSLRISPATLRKAKALGRGYTGILSRLLDLAIDDPDLVKKCL